MQRDLAISYNKLGIIAGAARRSDDARDWFERGLAVTRALAERDPGNTEWQRDLSISYEQLGGIAMSTGELDDARIWFDQSVAVRKALAAKDSTNADWQWDLCTSLAKRAELSLRVNAFAGVTSYLEDARLIYRQMQRAGLFQHNPAFARLETELDQLAAAIAARRRR